MKLPKPKSCDRVAYILDVCKGKRVLHLGCADWPFTETKAKKPTFLHRRISEVSDMTIGVDINQEAIKLMQNYGFDNVMSINAEVPLFESLRETFDVIIAGEIIEHVLNVGALLESIKTVMTKQSALIITTPNFAPIKRIPRLLFRTEEVHPDHIYYFSYSTMAKVLSLSGYEMLELRMHWWDVGPVSKIVNKICRKIPILQYYADTLVVSARLA